ncbi:MAG: DnaJ domain-containing protein [Myxococcales bacterium]|nr:DnaJ domain-containing protein [Myxococcales bacterium]
MSTDIPAPVAQGSFAKKPFDHLLLYLEQKELSGTLAVWPENDAEKGQDSVLFIRGKPAAGRFRAAYPSLEEGILSLFGRRSAPYAFYKADLVGSGPGVSRGRVGVWTLLSRGVRQSVPEASMDRLLAAYGDAKVRIRAGIDLERFAFEPPEAAFVQVLRAAPGSIQSLCSVSGNAPVAKRVLYILTLTRSLETYEGKGAASRQRAATPAGPTDVSIRYGNASAGAIPSKAPATASIPSQSPHFPSMPGPANTEVSGAHAVAQGSIPPPSGEAAGVPAPPPNLPAMLAKRWSQIAKKADEIEHQNYFQMLGLPDGATTSQASDAYLKAVKFWHPDRLPKELSDLKPWVDRVFHHLTEAKRVLTDEKLREEHIGSIAAGGGTPVADREVNAIVHAAMEFQKVEVIMRRGDWTEALKVIREVKALHDGDADYHATEAWILFNRHKGSSAPFDKMLAAVDKALELSPNHENAAFYKAKILKRKGEDDKALKYFKSVASMNPHNIEAAREVRIANMRKEGKNSGGDILSRFFKKK